MQTVTKTVSITKLYDSDTDANLEAQQFTTYDDMLNRMTPAPRTWDVTAKVVRADVFNAQSARDKAKVKLTIEARADDESRIDAWVEEYTKLHGRLAQTGNEFRDQLNSAAEAKRKEISERS
jgi:tRNA pseudouridine-54 N-methylase